MGIQDEAVGEAINLGSGVETKVVDMAHLVNKLTGNTQGIRYTKRRNWDVKHRLLSSIDKAKELLDYKPQTRFEDGVSTLYQWFETNWDAIQKTAEFPENKKQQWKNTKTMTTVETNTVA